MGAVVCRKYPSLIGDIRTSTFEDVYCSEAARHYREGPQACGGCRLRRWCGGCPAVTYGSGLKPLEDKDPFCFLGDE